MKICAYCESENDDSARVCAACGANEFKHRCNNCGTVFDEGEYCPKCGVKAGKKAKVCPRCGAEYFSNACPDCGYLAGQSTSAPTNPQAYSHGGFEPAQPQKKRNTALWVLGWIFLFPVPLTILVARSKKLPKWAKGLIIAGVWIAYYLMAFSK